jgi:3-hydroxy-3-methylglutaryl CoA synthase
MVGITDTEVYFPLYKITRAEIARMWGKPGSGGEKAVAAYDEDTVTMAVAAALGVEKRSEKKVDGLYFATTTAPYGEKQTAALIASAIDLEKECWTSDFANSVRAGTLAMKAAVDAVKSGSAENVMVLTSDCRCGAAQSTFEQILGDGAAAVMVGSKDVIAEVEAVYSVFDEIFDVWRTEDETCLRSSEERFTEEMGYEKIMKDVVSGIMAKHNLTPKDFAKIVFYAPDHKSHARMAKSLGFEKNQVEDPLYTVVGNTGTAAPFIMLAAALEKVSPNDRVLFVGYGNGADAFILRATENIGKARGNSGIKSVMEDKIFIDYGRYSIWKGLVTLEASRAVDRPVPSAVCLRRERKNILSLYGSRCKSCGIPQYPAGRVCVNCQVKDNMEEYKFSNKKGKLFSFSIDFLMATPNPPGVVGIVDFEGGGRILCEFSDYDPKKLYVDMPVEMTFRKLFSSNGINNYFWKARPVVEPTK